MTESIRTQAHAGSSRRLPAARNGDRRQQRQARAAVGLGLVAAAGLAVLALVTARTPAAQPVSSTPANPSAGDAGVGVGTAGLAPSIQPPPTISPGTATAGSPGSAAGTGSPTP